ncbi:hypothetical protein Asppvi_010943 [Aspergillus pseudoviridinutans]|uniref:Major facilitator superfamily (MFS) profile domain-containing protein n=1 Tax=Aspergillus pseudoviridinutans TaxID=1517512 RepID=A0A9P3BP85_9EURO|nr:uncharacterized protein Asppvi_010943 [Aspergillus pseudoviridinutans]GIJ91968.1 hypothetical protein Asppvi_010943 [Aspergillus pseudoviridinutans]
MTQSRCETGTEENLGRNQNGPTGDADNQATVPSLGTSGDLEKSSGQEPPNDATRPAPVKPPMFEVPDGGLVAWLQVAGGFSLFFNTWGNLNTFGIFQTYYEEGQLFRQSSSNIAWIGSIQAFLLLFVGAISGPIFDRGYLRTLLAVGSFLIIFGYMMLSICKAYWQVVLAQGFCIGIGGGLLFVPAIALLPTYFRRRLGLAVGLAAAGSSMGGIIYPIVFYRLINRIGFGWSTRVIGFISLATLLVPNLVMRQRIRPHKARALIDTTAFSDRPYLLFVFGAVTGFIGLYVLLFYISFYGEVNGYTNRSLSFYVIPILNAASVFGRTVPNAISDKTGPFNLIGPGALVCGILIFCMLAVKSAAGVVVVAALFGFFSGVFIALPPVCLAVLTKDKSKLGTRIGMAFGITSCSTLIGGPGAGAVLGADSTNLHWTRTWVFGGVFSIFSGCLFILLRGWTTGWKFMVKV